MWLDDGNLAPHNNKTYNSKKMSFVSQVFSHQTAGQIHRAFFQQQTGILRNKHSSTQVKRLFKRNPARRRVEARLGTTPKPEAPPAVTFQPILEPNILANGWCEPPGDGIKIPEYPFKVSRTKNKPNEAIGFLPVYSEYR
jgi:hypothetical protein